MKASESFQDLQDQLSHTDKNLWLGQFVWYSVSGVLIQHDDLVRALAANGLRGYVPRLPSDVDAFRRVCTKAQRKRVPSSTAGAYDNYLIRDLPVDNGGVHKVLVRETVQPGNLAYETRLCTISCKKVKNDRGEPVGEVTYNCVKDDVVAQQIVADILSSYQQEKGALNSHAVRELIRKMLLSNHAVNVRGDGGGLYFVPREEQDFFEHLEGFAALMPGKVQIDSHPVLDDSKRREMLRRAFLAEVDEEVDKVIDEITMLEKESKKISSARVESYLRQYAVVEEKVKEYDDLLETTHDTAHSALKIFQRQLLRLSTLVEV